MHENPIEIAERLSDGYNVRLLWRRGGGDVLVEITSERTEEIYELFVPPARAMDAFRNPRLYVSSPGARVVAPDPAGTAGAAPGIRSAA